jgi:predicted nucleotidyltransferase
VRRSFGGGKDGFALTDEEVIFLRELGRTGTKFMMVGMAAANLQGADKGTNDIDLWFKSTSDGGLDAAAKFVGGVFIWRANPPTLSGKNLARVDVVNRCQGLESFDREYANTLDVEIEDFTVKMLPLDRIIASKTAANRPKDRAALPALYASLLGNEILSRRR